MNTTDPAHLAAPLPDECLGWSRWLISAVTVVSCILRRSRTTPWANWMPTTSYAIHRNSSVRVAKLDTKKAGVPPYPSAGNCSIYGAGHKLDLDESDLLNRTAKVCLKS